VLTPKNVSTHYVLPQGWQALQVSTGVTNLGPIREWLTASLGTPISLGNPAKGIVWQPVPRVFSVWLSKSNDVCMLQISAPAPKKPL
jgi:hypothetical protein